MCGIAGVITFDSADQQIVRESADRMMRALIHRGPDGTGLWSATTAAGGAIAFAHTRLAIIDRSPEAAQPMTRGALTLTYNGEVFNYRSVRDELSADGDRFLTASDSEVLLAAFERWGTAAFDRLDGMWACGVWDAARQQLLLVRDRLGIKPLYVHRSPRHLVFASEVRAVLASGLVRPVLDRDSLWHYLGYQTAATPRTLLRDIDMIEPGHIWTVDADGRQSSRRYWSMLLPGTGDDAPPSRATAQATVGDLLHRAAASHLVADVPVGVFLSGGIDSGALVSVLTSIGVTPRTFTIGVDDDARLDEAADARELAQAFGAEHTEIRLNSGDVLDTIPTALAAFDHPSGDGINSYVIAKAAHDRGATVALSGLGADEVFGGYPSFRRLSRTATAASALSRTPGGLRRLAGQAVRRAHGGVAATKIAAAIESDGTLSQLWPITRQVFSPADRRRMLGLTGPEPIDAYARLSAAAQSEAPDAPLWARISHAEARTYMHDVLLRDVDQMSMAHSLEVRVPWLDHRLVSYVLSLPDAYKTGDSPKSLLVNSLARPLPAWLVRRPKRGFVLPFDAWMRGPLREFCERRLGRSGLDGRGILQPGEGTRLWRQFVAGSSRVTWTRVWTLIALSDWLERLNVEAAS